MTGISVSFISDATLDEVGMQMQKPGRDFISLSNEYGIMASNRIGVEDAQSATDPEAEWEREL